MEKYKLLGPSGFYYSNIPGTFGGYKPKKIYGKLDCSNALRWIKKGYYIKYRVFFAYEEDAIACGYRTCKICMKNKNE